MHFSSKQTLRTAVASHLDECALESPQRLLRETTYCIPLPGLHVLEWGPGICISSQFPDDGDATSLNERKNDTLLYPRFYQAGDVNFVWLWKYLLLLMQLFEEITFHINLDSNFSFKNWMTSKKENWKISQPWLFPLTQQSPFSPCSFFLLSIVLLTFSESLFNSLYLLTTFILCNLHLPPTRM